MSTRFFYQALEPFASFNEASDGTLHASLPEDWSVVIADIAGSTAAIEAGSYKDVNTVAAAMIMAVINVDRGCEIPFIFGGDGATLAVPPHMVEGAKSALRSSRKLAAEAFGLQLRVGLIPAGDILKRDLRLGVCKYRHSERINQASFSGFGWGWAESALKDPEMATPYMISQEGELFGDFTGFECRWRPVKARKDFKLAFIALSTAATGEGHNRVYRDLIQEIDRIYGKVPDYHPLMEKALELTTNPAKLRGEAMVVAKSRDQLSYFFGSLKLALTSVVGTLAFNFDLKLLGVRWGKYRREVVENADFRKFDGSLKMVIDSTADQEGRLQRYLEAQRAEGKLVFGIHRSSAAIMTCLIFTPGQDHAHFVDGIDGGYALAAKMLKQQLAESKLKRADAPR
jgi:hypothetical protein